MKKNKIVKHFSKFWWIERQRDSDPCLTMSPLFRILCTHSGLPRMLPIGTYPPGTGIIWMDDVDCVGNETNLDACKHRQLGTNNCDHSEDVAVACGPSIPLSEFSLMKLILRAGKIADRQMK